MVAPKEQRLVHQYSAIGATPIESFDNPKPGRLWTSKGRNCRADVRGNQSHAGVQFLMVQ
jgi:hypothetical protein